MSKFVHLHLHTQYSILDGAASIKVLMKRAKELGMESIAITDHGNMFGVKEFYDIAKREGIKPILGCEVYVVKDRHEKDKDEKAGDHLVLLAKDLEGYHNLIKIVSYSWTDGFYYKPRIDKTLLKEFGKGLICSSACLGGEIPQAIMAGNLNRASKVIEEFKELFGDDYYLEMQLHKSGDMRIDSQVYDNQVRVNKAIAELANKHSVKLIATNDVHYVMADDAPAHDLLICLNTGRDLNDPNRMRYTTQEYLKTYEEMAALFPDHPEALQNTLEIAAKIETYELEHKPLMPNFPLPDEFEINADELKRTFRKKISDETLLAELDACDNIDSFVEKQPEFSETLIIAQQYLYLRYITYKGVKERYDNLTEKILERLEFELQTIEWMGFPGYFLIVWDFIRAGREMGVSVGPGRGSAAGSVVAYSLRITNIDPLKYNLLFERFLNPDRISLPDVDIDFDEDGRAKVLEYVNQKYGVKRVAQIVTFGTMAPKMAIRDVARVQNLPLQESDRLAKLVPERPGTSFADAYKEVAELSQERNSSNPLIVNTLKYAERLEGSIRQTGVHACGVIIGPDDLEKYAPLATAKDKDGKEELQRVVQFDGRQVESIGLIKMDFLGLKTLSIIKDAVENIEITRGENIDVDLIDFEDEATYELYSRGETTGLFQFESPGMKKHLRNLKPNRFEDLIAMNALYRPGPMEYIPSFIARKNGQEKVQYDIAEMEKYLSDTYGITVYQEQVMLLSQSLAGFTGGEADTLRKAMGKKQKKVLDKLKPKFLKGTSERGHDTAICEKIWGDWEAFASYAFNKSHSTCYAYISYQTAYLKCHYPAEFMAALLSRNLSDINKIRIFMDECKRMNTPVLGPDVNRSYHKFSADKRGDIRFGLGAVKGVGEAAVKAIIDERDANGEFVSIYDFFERVNLQTVNKRTLENLAMAGAFDNLWDFHRSKFFASDSRSNEGLTLLEMLVRYGNRTQSEKNNSQQSLFGGMESAADIQKPEPSQCEDWPKLETLNKERELIGIYLSSHPLDDYEALIENFCNMPVSELDNLESIKGKDFVVAGMVTSVSNLFAKNGNPYGKFTLEDYNGSYQFALFGKEYEQFRQYIYPDYFLMLRGKVAPKWNDGPLGLRMTSVMQLSEVQENMVKEMSITIPIDEITDEFVEEIYGVIGDSKGNINLRVRVVDFNSQVSLGLISRTTKVALTKHLIGFCKDNDLRYNLM